MHIDPARQRPARHATSAPLADGPGDLDVFQQIGLITRQLHDALTDLGALCQPREISPTPREARSRLGHVAQGVADAVTQVLDGVDRVRADTLTIRAETAGILAALDGDPARPVDIGVLIGFVLEIQSAARRSDACLAAVPRRQDIHDQSHQMLARVLAIVARLERRLVEVLLRASASSEPASASAARR